MRAFITRQLISNSFRKECKTVYNNFNSVDIIKRFNDQFTSTIYQQFVDDLYYCIWHLENYYFDKIWAFRFQNSPKYNQMASLSFLKNVYRGSCSFLIPHGNLSSFIQSSIFQPFRLILKNENKVISRLYRLTYLSDIKTYIHVHFIDEIVVFLRYRKEILICIFFKLQ